MTCVCRSILTVSAFGSGVTDGTFVSRHGSEVSADAALAPSPSVTAQIVATAPLRTSDFFFMLLRSE